MPFIFWRSYQATVSQSVWKAVRCEQCSTEFVYKMICQAESTGASLYALDDQGAKARASRRAREQVQAGLASECAPVPCPQCGWYQRHMIPRARTLYKRWMVKAGGVMIPISVLLLAVLYVLTFGGRQGEPLLAPVLLGVGWGVGGLLAAIGPGLLIARYVLASRYTPNREPAQTRKQLGQSLALRREEFEKLADAARRQSGAGAAPQRKGKRPQDGGRA
jgi:hypothetical protein